MNTFVDKMILVPVDLSEESDLALDYALHLVAKPEQITALHVGISFGAAIDPPYIYPIVVEPEYPYEKTIRSHLSNAKYRGIHLAIRYGDAGHEIANFAKEIKADLIVMPSHGRTGLSHFFLGSVAEHVVRYASCPVLVLRGETRKGAPANCESGETEFALSKS